MESTLHKLKVAVLEGEDETAGELAAVALAEGHAAAAVLTQAVVAGMQAAGVRWQKNEYFLPDIVMSAEAFREAMAVLSPQLSDEGQNYCGRYLIGTVSGNVHNLGKMIVVAMLRGAGFEVIDMGEDVSPETFVERTRVLQPDILGVGCYMTPTLTEVGEIVRRLDAAGVRPGTRVMVGGVPTSQEFADEIGADAWGKDALDAVAKAQAMLEVRP